jgi:hypothetical protein
MRRLRLAGLEIWWEYINAIVIGAAGGWLSRRPQLKYLGVKERVLFSLYTSSNVADLDDYSDMDSVTALIEVAEWCLLL